MCIMYHGYLLSFCPSNDASFWMSPGSNPSLSGNIIALVGISKSLQPVFSFMVTSKSVQRPRSVTTKPSACPITNFALAAEEAADPPWHGTRLPDRVTQCHICHYEFTMCRTSSTCVFEVWSDMINSLASATHTCSCAAVPPGKWRPLNPQQLSNHLTY